MIKTGWQSVKSYPWDGMRTRKWDERAATAGREGRLEPGTRTTDGNRYV